MKKILSLALVTIMLVTTLASCSLLDKMFSKDEENLVDTVDRTVTEEEWNANMGITNYEVYQYSFGTDENGNLVGSEETPEVIWQYTEDAEYSIVNGRFNSAHVLIDGKWYWILKGSDSADPTIVYPARLDEDHVHSFGFEWYKYSDFTYDADLGAYVKSESDVITDYGTYQDFKCYCYFENNVIVKIEQVGVWVLNDGTKTDVVIRTVIKNIGTTVIDLPKYVVE